MSGRAGVPVLGIDVGSTNVKAALVHLDPDAGTVTPVAVRAAATPPTADALVGAVHDLVRSVLDGRPAPEAVGIASMAETGVPLGRDGVALTGLLRWDGRRDAQDAERLARDLGRDALFRATGVRPSPKVPLATWAWLRRTEPALWGRVARWAGAADLVCLALTGRLVTDHTLAGRSMAYRLPAPGEPVPESFDADLLATVGLVPGRLPDVARPGAVAGTVVGGEAVRAGLRAGTPVVVAGHDHAVGVWAAGTRLPGHRADSIGTAEAVVTVLGAPVDRDEVARQGMSLVRTAAGTHEALLAGSPAAGAMVTWWMSTVLPGRGLDRVLTGVTVDGPTRLLVLPYPSGRQAPDPDPSAQVRVLDERDVDVTAAVLRPRAADAGDADAGGPVRSPDTRGTVAMLEGLVMQARWLLDAQARIAGGARPDDVPGDGAPPDDVPPHDGPLRVLAGAAAANSVWMDLKAAATPGHVALVTTTEPVATGACLLAAERAGLVPAGRLRLPARELVAPPDAVAARYDAVLERFVAAARDRAPRSAAPAPSGSDPSGSDPTGSDATRVDPSPSAPARQGAR